MKISDYYQDKYIHKKIAEYCGSNYDTNPKNFTSEYLVGYGLNTQNSKPFVSTSCDNFYWILNNNLDIFRSVWDRKYLLGILDIEYFNTKYPGEIFLKPDYIFNQIEPIYQYCKNIFLDFGIKPLILMTGQGYHFSFKINKTSSIFSKLVKIGKPSTTVLGKYKSVHGRRRKIVSKNEAFAYDGMGRLIEFIAFKILQNTKNFKYPVVITDVAVGNNEAVSLDLSMYGDPIFMRDIRCPFSLYQKHKLIRYKYGDYITDTVPFFITLPRFVQETELKLNELLKIRKNFKDAINLSKKINTEIPDNSENLKTLLDSYCSSTLYKFHKDFDSVEHDPPSIWYKTYDCFHPIDLPPCVRHCINFPNDNLLKPTNIQTLTRVLLKKNWHPKHIAGLVRSKFERDYGWGREWFKYDAATRANFYVRIFAGQVLTNIDEEIDLNCVSHQQKGYCWQPWCGFNLSDYKL